MIFTDLPDEIIARVLFTLFQKTRKVKDVISMISTNKDLYYKFGYLPYTWVPYTLNNVVPSFSHQISLLNITSPVKINLHSFNNIKSLNIKLSNVLLLDVLSTITATLKQLTVILDSSMRYVSPRQLQDLYNNINCRFQLECFRVSSIKPIMKVKYRQIFTAPTTKKWVDKLMVSSDRFTTEIGNLIYIILYLGKKSLKFIQIELIDMSLIFNNDKKRFRFETLKLLSFDNSSIIRFHLWLIKFIKLNKTIQITVSNSFNDTLLVNKPNWTSWREIKNSKLALQIIKADLNILDLG